MLERDGRSPSVGFPWRLALVTVLALALVASLALLRRAAPVPPSSSSRIEVRPSPNVLVAIHDLARLETASYHMERVVEMTDAQTHLWGLIDTQDLLLLIAVGEVGAGVDMQKLAQEDVAVDWAKRAARIKLPRAEVFSATLDNERTHVYSRKTGALADRREDLEGLARRDAEQKMKVGALEAGILARAQANAERTLRSLLHSLGFEDVQIEWKGH